jgi:hypothetical protein
VSNRGLGGRGRYQHLRAGYHHRRRRESSGLSSMAISVENEEDSAASDADAPSDAASVQIALAGIEVTR